MEQLSFLPALRDLRGERKGVRRARREHSPRATGQPSSLESGQAAFDFERARAVRRAPPLRAVPVAQCERDAEAWYQLGCEVEPADAARARTAYARALLLDPAHADAHLNLGCLDHEAGRLAQAEAHYRAALTARAADATARFDLAVALEDQERVDEAREAYLACLADDPAYAEAHYNLARLCERAGDLAAALRHLMAYRRLVTE
jgi:tetratricopeptide (TPR) repeat protein